MRSIDQNPRDRRRVIIQGLRILAAQFAQRQDALPTRFINGIVGRMMPALELMAATVLRRFGLPATRDDRHDAAMRAIELLFHRARRRDTPGVIDDAAAWQLVMAACESFRKKPRKRQVVFVADLPESVEMAHRSDVLSLEASEQWSAVLRALNGLCPGHRQVIVLRFLEERSLDEMAGIIGKKKSAISTQISHALGALRESLPPHSFRGFTL